MGLKTVKKMLTTLKNQKNAEYIEMVIEDEAAVIECLEFDFFID